MLYSVTLALTFKAKHFLLTQLLLKKIAQAANVRGRFVSTRTARAAELLLLILGVFFYFKRKMFTEYIHKVKFTAYN